MKKKLAVFQERLEITLGYNQIIASYAGAWFVQELETVNLFRVVHDDGGNQLVRNFCAVH